ncbi:Pelo protein [Giardia muris]|uniref:Pelo protein n=1 Tax=Giardia muris TaxID=5742 RepID=A0A4Z1SNZ2_GIAMU|nr:Pelo protein [Giardia muris]|eukprot:TNJ27516.1 Pelo protein [Giardia muris]
MRLLKKTLEPDGSGIIEVCPTEEDDLYVLSEVIRPGDRVRGKTTRKIIKTRADGSSTTARRSLRLTIAVETVTYDGGCSLSISGRVVSEVEDIPKNSAHTIWLQPHGSISISKGHWEGQQLTVIDEACDPRTRCDMAATLLLRDGTAKLGLLNPDSVVPLKNVHYGMPKKTRYNTDKMAKSLTDFFRQTCATLERALIEKIRVLLFCGQDEVLTPFKLLYQSEMAQRPPFKGLATVYIPTTQTVLHKVIMDAMTIPSIAEQIGACRWVLASRALEEFRRFFVTNEGLAHYTSTDVLHLLNESPFAIRTIVYLTSLVHGQDVGLRRTFEEHIKKYSDTIDFIEVRPQSVPGQLLQTYGGIIALTKYPVEYERCAAQNTDDSELSSF